MRNKYMLLALITVTALGSFAAYSLAFSKEQRSDYPAAVVCPINGDEVCKDRCPLMDAGRADCPGKVDCPLTDEPVCADQCPVESATEDTAAATPERGIAN